MTTENDIGLVFYHFYTERFGDKYKIDFNLWEQETFDFKEYAAPIE